MKIIPSNWFPVYETFVDPEQYPVQVILAGKTETIYQQPANRPDVVYINGLTEFGLVRYYYHNTIGLLAHNSGNAGWLVAHMRIDDQIQVIWSNRKVHVYQVAEIIVAEADSPDSVHSWFFLNGNKYSASQMFDMIYGNPEYQLVFQTCVAKDGVVNAGRKFVMARILK